MSQTDARLIEPMFFFSSPFYTNMKECSSKLNTCPDFFFVYLEDVLVFLSVHDLQEKLQLHQSTFFSEFEDLVNSL